MILDLFSNLWCIWCVAPFLLESPASQGDAPPGWKVFTGALTYELFQSLSHTHTSTAPVAAPLWVLEHTLTGDPVKHSWPDQVGPALCKSKLWCPGCPFLAAFRQCWTLCQPTLQEQSSSLDAHLCHQPPIPTATPSHYKCQYCSFNLKRDVPRNWPLLMAMYVIKKYAKWKLYNSLA